MAPNLLKSKIQAILTRVSAMRRTPLTHTNDITTADAKRQQMAKVRSKHTTPELAVRRALHARGLRFRLHSKDLPGKPDLAFPKHRLALFVHGCFWHGCTKCNRGLRRPKQNSKFWNSKLKQNQSRDDRNIAHLIALGWRTAVIWECATRKAENLAKAIDEVVAMCESCANAKHNHR